jgi:hypothetical protein
MWAVGAILVMSLGLMIALHLGPNWDFSSRAPVATPYRGVGGGGGGLKA